MNRIIYLILGALLVNALPIYSEDYSDFLKLKMFRLKRMHRKQHIYDAHFNFVKKIDAIVEAPVQATPDKIVFFEDSRTVFKRLWPTAGSVADPVDMVCKDPELSAAESKFLEQRKQFGVK